MNRRLPLSGGARARVADTALALVVAVGVTGIITLGLGGDRPADLGAYLIATLLGAVLLVRRQLPRAVLVVSIVALFGYYALDYPAIGVALPVLAAHWSAAERGATWWAIGGAVVVTGATIAFRVVDGEPLDVLLGSEMATNAALFAAAIALGAVVRSRRVARTQQGELDRLADEQRERASEDAARTERERISRELHDSIGHALTVISMQASAASQSIGRDEQATTTALAHVRDTANAALVEVRRTLRPLRARDDLAVHSFADAPALLARVRGAGLDVEARIEVADGALSPAVDRAAYRILQESLTNAVRHARATRIDVDAHVADDELVLRVADDGRGSDASSDGTGISGMRERARLLGGELTAGPRADGGRGFVIEARIPARMTP